MLAASRVAGKVPRLGLHLEKGQVADLEFERPFYDLIVDGIHSHPNSVRVCLRAIVTYDVLLITAAASVQRVPRRMRSNYRR